LTAAHRESGAPVLVRVFDERSSDDLRALCRALTQAGVARVVLAARGPAPFVIAGRPRDGKSFDMRGLLPVLKEAAGGRGGGGPDEIQAPFADGESAARAAERLSEDWRGRA
jgi:alanyl-tRNA synthetase